MEEEIRKNTRKKSKNNNPFQLYKMKKEIRKEFEEMKRPEIKLKYIYKKLAEKYLLSEIYVMKIIKE